jgi:uncharacterized membrane protein
MTITTTTETSSVSGLKNKHRQEFKIKEDRSIKELEYIARIPEANYPFWIIYLSFLRVGKMRVEIMHLTNGIGSSI